MDPHPKTDRLKRMMRVYESPRHDVVGFALDRDQPLVRPSGPGFQGPAPEDMIFEIGSVTKVLAGILLCLLVEEGQVDPQAPLRHMASELRHVPDWITPEKLTAHISGLPNIHLSLWTALTTSWPESPYATFTRTGVLDWVRNHARRPRENRPRHRYSNLGVGLLGEAISLLEGRDFSRVLKAKVLLPMGLTDTVQHPDTGQRDRLVQPRTPGGKPVAPWRFEALAAAGCLRSTARDLTRFSGHVLRALDRPETALDRAICRSVQPVFGLGRGGAMDPQAQCSGWLRARCAPAGPVIFHHNGGTAGSTCALYICPEKSSACGVLSNNGLAGHLWGSLRLERADPLRQAEDFFTAP